MQEQFDSHAFNSGKTEFYVPSTGKGREKMACQNIPIEDYIYPDIHAVPHRSCTSGEDLLYTVSGAGIFVVETKQEKEPARSVYIIFLIFFSQKK